MNDETHRILWDIVKAQNPLGHALQQLHQSILDSETNRIPHIHKSVTLSVAHAEVIADILAQLQAVQIDEKETSK